VIGKRDRGGKRVDRKRFENLKREMDVLHEHWDWFTTDVQLVCLKNAIRELIGSFTESPQGIRGLFSKLSTSYPQVIHKLSTSYPQA